MRRQIIITICTTSAERRMVLPQQDDTTFGERRIIFRRNFVDRENAKSGHFSVIFFL